MSPLTRKLKPIWRWSNGLGVVVFLGLVPALLGGGAEVIPALILGAVGGVVVRLALLFALVPLLAPELSRFVSDAKVERVGDDVSVESAIAASGDRELDGYIRSYAFAKDHTIKTIVLLMTAAILIAAITVIHGPILF